ncbi:MAG TPA: dihydrolipoamide acetyltransferase family protein, partial [Gemmatimonadales bacterium]|nr:dihydrolipoamide acetyltransferase family protein [Gemmatimonadales bacterium]
PADSAGPKPEKAAADVAPAAKRVDPAPADAAAELSPAVRRLLVQHGLDASSIRGTGRAGRITVQDVEAFAAKAPARAPAQPAPGAPPGRRVPHTTMRRTIAEHMKRSVETAPHVTALFEADLSAVVRHRGALPEAERPTFTAYFVRATVEAIRAVPEANSRWHDDALEIFDDCNVGVAVALPSGGLIVPVLHRAQDQDLSGIARRLRDLTDRARAGRLEPREVHGGTFTISNHGVSGSLLAAPIIINQPQSAILGVGKLEQRVKVTPSGSFEARPCAYVTLTVDHRVLDGFQANAFLTRWVEAIERWS